MARKRMVAALLLVTAALAVAAGGYAENGVVVTVTPSQGGDAVVRWVDLSADAQDGTWPFEYEVQACYDPASMPWDTLSVVDGRKAFFFLHRGAWAEGLHYRVVVRRK